MYCTQIAVKIIVCMLSLQSYVKYAILYVYSSLTHPQTHVQGAPRPHVEEQELHLPANDNSLGKIPAAFLLPSFMNIYVKSRYICRDDFII